MNSEHIYYFYWSTLKSCCASRMHLDLNLSDSQPMTDRTSHLCSGTIKCKISYLVTHWQDKTLVSERFCHFFKKKKVFRSIRVDICRFFIDWKEHSLINGSSQDQYRKAAIAGWDFFYLLSCDFWVNSMLKTGMVHSLFEKVWKSFKLLERHFLQTVQGKVHN